MKKKYILIILFVFISIISITSFGLNIYFLATKPLSVSGIFIFTKDSILEIKAETEDVGISYGTAIIVSDDGTLVTNAHVITYKKLGVSYTFDNISVRFIDEEDFTGNTTQTIRQWLSTQSFDTQYQFGIEKLLEFAKDLGITLILP